MRTLIAVAVMVPWPALPVCAQRGGHGGGMSHGGGGFASRGGASFSGGFASHSSGFAGRSAPTFRGSSTAMGRTSFAGSPVGAGRIAGVAPRVSGIGAGARPVYTKRRPGYPVGNQYRRPWVPVYGLGVPYGVAGWYGGDCGWYWDCGYGFYDNGDLDYGYASQGYGSSGYVAPAADYSADQSAQPVQQAEAPAGDGFRPAYVRPQPEEDAVTLVFKDGRPNQQIHNYMLTRTTVYVQDERRREIPVDELDLAATEKVNKDAGVEFRLPGGAS